nr:UDP glucose 6 dehydrogenase [Hymenolepis microstoma]CDS34614.2 UDP glucose 6 dehydrogenase [Hymenolepis microstoma]
MTDSHSIKVERICCVGAGYVGTPTSAVIALKCPEIQVTVVDVNSKRIAAWNSDKLPIKEPGLLEIVKACRGKNLHFSTDVEMHANEADIIFICVNTPTKSYGIGMGRAADLTTLESATRTLSACFTTSKVVVEKSTVPVRSAARVAELLNNQSPKNLEHTVLSNPEFLAEGTAIKDLLQPDRILIGGDENSVAGRRGLEMLTWVYKHWVPEDRIILTSVWSSELSKLAANAFLAQRISSINAVSAICEATGADVREVSAAISRDSRIGPHFLQASLGFGGSCFRKDILNLTYICESLNLSEVASYWNMVLRLNDHQMERFSRSIIRSMFNNLRGKRIAIFGFAFKKNTGDTRIDSFSMVTHISGNLAIFDLAVVHDDQWESPAIRICSILLSEYAHLAVFDPQVSDEQIINDLNETTSHDIVHSNLTICHSPMEAAVNSHAIVICTEWDEFKILDYESLYDVMCKPAWLFDGRLILDHQKLKKIGFHVKTIGVCSNGPLDSLYFSTRAIS